ncbi:hypothetical protein [Planobispora longispora]|uniref:hypothetical protein n=1 Tax=Planobispora longispora TaxID=28887 RepID=UPI0019420EBA
MPARELRNNTAEVLRRVESGEECEDQDAGPAPHEPAGPYGIGQDWAAWTVSRAQR